MGNVSLLWRHVSLVRWPVMVRLRNAHQLAWAFPACATSLLSHIALLLFGLWASRLKLVKDCDQHRMLVRSVKQTRVKMDGRKRCAPLQCDVILKPASSRCSHGAVCRVKQQAVFGCPWALPRSRTGVARQRACCSSQKSIEPNYSPCRVGQQQFRVDIGAAEKPDKGGAAVAGVLFISEVI